MNKKDPYKIIIGSVRIFFMAVLAAMLVYYILYTANDKKLTGISESGARTLSYWTGQNPDGSSFKFEPGKTYEYDKNGTIFLSTRLPSIQIDDCYLALMTLYDTEVYVDGVLRKDFVASRDIRIPGDGVKPIFIYVPLYSYDSGRTVTIVRHRLSKFRNTFSFSPIIMGCMSDIYLYATKLYGTTFTLDATIFIISIIIIIAGLILRYRLKQNVYMIYAGFATFMTAGWMLTDSYYFPFVMRHNNIDGLLSYFFCLLLPIPYFAYIRSLQNGRYKKFYMTVYIINILNTMLWTILHFTGAVKFYDAYYAIDTVLILMIICFFAVLIKETKDGYVRSYRFTAIGFVLFSLFALLEIGMIITPGFENNGTMLLLGLLAMLGFAVIQQYADFRKTDIQRRRALELSDAKTNFLASMSHEIRTPINSILGMNEMILRENRDPAIESYATTVQQSGKMLLSLVNDVLDFSKIEAGKLEITNVRYRLSSLISDISAMARERCEQKSLNYNLVISGDIPDGLIGDEFRIKQILVNFISNAVKYTDSGLVQLRVHGEYATGECYDLSFDVVDTGQGIKADEIDHLFDAFTRIDSKKNRYIEGTGLGLAIVKNIVDSMGGKLSVKSDYGEGSIFSVTIPQTVFDIAAVPTDLSRLSNPEVSIKAHHVCDFTAPSAHLLAVDDNRPNLAIVEQFLKITKVKLDLCTSGTTAVEKCRNTAYDLILLDHMMPDPDGIETLKLIRADVDSKNHDTPAVVLTANAMEGSRKTYIDAGFEDYLTKPLDSTTLENTVKKFIPKEKLISVDDEPLEFEAVEETTEDQKKTGIASIPGINYETALRHTGGYEDILIRIMTDIAKDALQKTDDMRKAVAADDIDSYRLKVHSIKGTMATIGADHLSERARLHETAAKEGNRSFIEKDLAAFLDEYETLCKNILKKL